MSAQRLMVVAAHSGDFVWRAAGLLARHSADGGAALVLALSYGIRGESAHLWAQHGQTTEGVRRARHDEAARAAALCGAEFVPLDLDDFPLHVDRGALDRIAGVIGAFRPDVMVTHADRDPFNPDHAATHHAAITGRAVAIGTEAAAEPPRLYAFEPHQPETCGFTPTDFVDITPVMAVKQAAMTAMGSQAHLAEFYRRQAQQRASHARKAGGGSGVEFAEAFQKILPTVADSL